MAAQSGVVVEDAERQRPLLLAAGRERLEGAVVEIEMPQGADICGLETADLARLASTGSAGFDAGETCKAVESSVK